MKLLGQYLLAEKYKSVAMLSLLTVMSLLIPPLTYIISATPFALITLRKGGKYGLQVMIYTLLAISIFGYFSRIGFGLGANIIYQYLDSRVVMQHNFTCVRIAGIVDYGCRWYRNFICTGTCTI